jgi:hypothetical protein
MTLLQVRQFNARFLRIAQCSEAYDPLTMEGILAIDRGLVHLLNSSVKTEWRKPCRCTANPAQHDKKPALLTDTVAANLAAMRWNEMERDGSELGTWEYAAFWD